eukprot:14565532-Alexandrium_andersonii.AAC.1
MSWNCRTLDPMQHAEATDSGLACGGKVVILDDVLHNAHCDIVCLQGARFRTSATFQECTLHNVLLGLRSRSERNSSVGA